MYRKRIGSSFTFINILQCDIPLFLENFNNKSLEIKENCEKKIEINMLYFIRISKLYEIIENKRYGTLARELHKSIKKKINIKNNSMKRYRECLLNKNRILQHIIKFFNNSIFKSIIKKLSECNNIYTIIGRTTNGYNLIGGKDIEYELPLYTTVRELKE